MKNTRLALALLLPTLAACAVLTKTFRPPWVAQDQITIPHERHKKADVDCLACHETVYDAENLEARHLPKEDKCMECHAEEREAGRCIMCHSSAKTAETWPTAQPRLNFNHVTHLERTQEDCARCHTQLPEPKVAATRPSMNTCLGCHEHKVEFQAGRCDGCHKDITQDRLKPLDQFSHQGNFVLEHRFAARSSVDSCMVCHTQSQCVACHNATPPVRVEVQQPMAVDRNLIHRNDFLSRHNLEAQADPAQCMRCHGNSFCSDCHKAQNLTPSGDNPRNPHPATGFVQRGGAAFHGEAARQNVSQCASCHDQGPETNCINCHRVGAAGGNPHPPGWVMDHNRQDIRLNGMCMYCHQ